MGDSSISPARTTHNKLPWPILSVIASGLLWLMAWEVIVWFVPLQPRLILQGSEDLYFLMGFSPDGKTLVTVAGDRDPAQPGQIYHLWDVETGNDLGVVGSIGAVGSDEKTLLPNVVYRSQRDLRRETDFPWNAANTYTLYDLTNRRETNSIQLTPNPNVYTSFCFSLNGRTLACCIYQNDELDPTRDKSELWLIDVATGQVRARLTAKVFGNYLVRSLALSDDGGTLAVLETKPSGDDNVPDEEKVVVVDAATGKIPWTFQFDEEEIWHLAFSPDGSKLAIYSSVMHSEPKDTVDTQIRVCDRATGELMTLFKGKGEPEFLPDNKRIALIDYDHISFRDVLTGKEFAAANVTRYFDVFLHGAAVIAGSNVIAIPTMHDSKPNLFFEFCTKSLGIKAPGNDEWKPEISFLDSRTGSKIAGIVRKNMIDAKTSPDGRTLALATRENDESIVEIWDIPPRKPVGWVLGLWAIPSIVTLFTFWRWWKARLFPFQPG
jgi:WD40 repeat protein